MQAMTEHECRQFLLERPRTASLATVRADGRPHVAPIWFDLEGDTMLFTTWHTTVKARNMRHNPCVSLSVDDETPPFAFVLLEGEAHLGDELAEVRHWATRIAGRYMGAALAEAYGTRNGVPGELLVRVQLTHIIGQKEIAG
ncbi:MAG: PPOX class F420-dependent oxidoreductase [Chloroflexaceae bacterium]|jgi:hypothetical protein|nr:PPOX class F420-dependent oxidoreductase [Chloroflexaceae bacterium]